MDSFVQWIEGNWLFIALMYFTLIQTVELISLAFKLKYYRSLEETESIEETFVLKPTVPPPKLTRQQFDKVV